MSDDEICMHLGPEFAALSLISIAFMLLMYIIQDRREYAAFKRLASGAARIQYYRKWVLTAFVLFGLSSLLLLFIIGRMRDVVYIPVEFASLRLGGQAGAAGLSPEGRQGFLIGAAIGSVALVGVLAIQVLRLAKAEPALVGDVDALLPRSKAELGWAAALSVNAGISEELFFRLLVPLLVTTLTGSALGGFAVATALFGLTHIYQGWSGVVVTAAVGALFALIYLQTQSLFAVMAVHALADLRVLVLGPALRMWAPKQKRQT